MLSLRKSVVPIYRIFSMFSLYGILAGIILYGALFAFFLGTNSWVAPFTVSPSDGQVLAITAQITSSQATMDTLQLDYKSSQENMAFNKSQLAGLYALGRQLRSKVMSQSSVWAATSENLAKFDQEAKDNIAIVQKDVGNGEEMRRLVKRDLAAGLITNEDALSTYSYIDMLAVNSTTAKVAESDLQDSIRQHKMDDISSLAVEGQKTALEFQISQLYSSVRQDQQHMISDLETLATIKRAVDTAKLSPYFKAVNAHNIQLGVMPYDPKSTVKSGTAVYNCLVGILICREVGQVVDVYPNELVFENPLSKTNTRGFVVQLKVTDEAMRTKALLVGRKPLLF